MKTTHEKLLISLLALGLTSSAGLYAQSNNTNTNTNVQDGNIPANNVLVITNPLNEDIDGDGFFDINEDLNGDGFLNNGGTGAPLVPGGPATLLPGEGNLLNEDVNNNGLLDAGEDLNGNGTLDLAINEDFDGDGLISLSEDQDGNGFQAIGEDTDGDGNLDVNEDINGDGFLNNGGTGAPLVAGGPATLLPGEGALLNEDANNNGLLDAGEDLNGNGVLDTAINEDVDGDGSLDTFAEDVNGNGVLDNTDRTFLQAVNPQTGAEVDLDILVANGLFVNGQQVATQLYVDNADALLQAQITTNTADIATNARGIANNRRDIDSNTRGIAMVAALQTTTVLPGMTQALDLSAAHFEGETGLAINYSRRINDNVQINFGAATTSDGDENVVKAGIGWQW
jgi:hypothetical protein